MLSLVRITAQGGLPGRSLADSAPRRRRNALRSRFVLPVAERFLDDIRDLSLDHLDLDPDLDLHRHLPQPRPVRLGQGAVVPVRAVHPAYRRAGLPDRPRWLDA